MELHQSNWTGVPFGHSAPARRCSISPYGSGGSVPLHRVLGVLVGYLPHSTAPSTGLLRETAIIARCALPHLKSSPHITHSHRYRHPCVRLTGARPRNVHQESDASTHRVPALLMHMKRNDYPSPPRSVRQSFCLSCRFFFARLAGRCFHASAWLDGLTPHGFKTNPRRWKQATNTYPPGKGGSRRERRARVLYRAVASRNTMLIDIVARFPSNGRPITTIISLVGTFQPSRTRRRSHQRFRGPLAGGCAGTIRPDWLPSIAGPRFRRRSYVEIELQSLLLFPSPNAMVR